MALSGMLRRVALVRTDVSEELTRATWRNIPEDAILHSNPRTNLKSFTMSVLLKNMFPFNSTETCSEVKQREAKSKASQV
jgi:hypothetical protein